MTASEQPISDRLTAGYRESAALEGGAHNSPIARAQRIHDAGRQRDAATASEHPISDQLTAVHRNRTRCGAPSALINDQQEAAGAEGGNQSR